MPTGSPICTSRSPQLNTDKGFGGECHLDANMVRTALGALPLDELDLLIIENVGNLVCPAEFHVGADARIMVCSVTEGEDKPLKYPLMYRACELVIINKIDLLQHLDFDIDALEANIAQVNPDAATMRVSARTGEGVDALRRWLAGVPARATRAAVLTEATRPAARRSLRGRASAPAARARAARRAERQRAPAAQSVADRRRRRQIAASSCQPLVGEDRRDLSELIGGAAQRRPAGVVGPPALAAV